MSSPGETDRCTCCGGYTPEYLITEKWREDLANLLNRAANEHIIPDVAYMDNLELFTLFLSLKNQG